MIFVLFIQLSLLELTACCLEQHFPSCPRDPEMLDLVFVYIYLYSKYQELHLWATKKLRTEVSKQSPCSLELLLDEECAVKV